MGAPGRDPELSPLPGNGGAAGTEKRVTLGRRVRSVAAAAAASRQVGAGAEGSPSGPHAQPAVLARPGSLSSEARTAGARQRGQRTVIGRRRAGGSGRGATGSAQPHWWSLRAGRRLRWRAAGLPGGWLSHSAGLRSSEVYRASPLCVSLWRTVLGMQGGVSYHPCPYRARGNCCTREDCYGRISHGVSREHRKGAVNP